MSDLLKEKVAIVTGAGRGIGAGIARVFASEGAKVLVVDMDESWGRKCVAEIERTGGEASFFKADITKFSQMQEMAQTALDRYGRIDVLCNNAGIYYPVMGISELTEEAWDNLMNINVKGSFLSVKAVLPQMLKQKYGRILITSSTTGNRSCIMGLTHYAASKAAVNGFIKNAAFELAETGVTVNGVEPGNILTEGILATVGEEYVKANEAVIPMGHLGTPEDIGHAMAYLASDGASYVTGQTIVVDGGQGLPESGYGTGR